MAMEDTEFMRSLVEAESGSADVKTVAIQRLYVIITGKGSPGRDARATSLAAIQAAAARFAALT